MSGVIHLTESKPADFPKCQVLLKISIKCFSWYVNFSHHQFHVSMGYHQLTQKNDLFPVLVDHFLQSNRLNSEDRDTKIYVWKKMNVYVPNISCNYIKNLFDSFVCPLHSSWSSYSHFSMWTSDDHESADGKHATEHVICIIMTSSPTVITGSFSAEEKKTVPTVWPHRQWSSLGSRPRSFDVAALFVHQRQWSVLSHSTICHLLNPSLWLGRGGIVCIFTPGGEKHAASFTPLEPRFQLQGSFCRDQMWLLTCSQIQRGLHQTAGSVVTDAADWLFSFLSTRNFFFGMVDVLRLICCRLEDIS